MEIDQQPRNLRGKKENDKLTPFSETESGLSRCAAWLRICFQDDPLAV